MKTTIKLLGACLALTVLTTSSAYAWGRNGGGRGNSQRRQQILEEFDADGDGQLSDSEKETARATMKERRQSGERSSGRSGKREKRGGGNREERKQKMLDEFDADGDGELSESERETAKAKREERHAERMAEMDTDGDGEVSDEEKEAAREAKKAEMETLKEQFDVDGNGELSEEERKELHAYMEENGIKPPGKRGRGKGRRNKSGTTESPLWEKMMLQRFDANGDGQLSDDEREAARGERQSSTSSWNSSQSW